MHTREPRCATTILIDNVPYMVHMGMWSALGPHIYARVTRRRSPCARILHACIFCKHVFVHMRALYRHVVVRVCVCLVQAVHVHRLYVCLVQAWCVLT